MFVKKSETERSKNQYAYIIDETSIPKAMKDGLIFLIICFRATVQPRLDFTPARQATFQGQIIDLLPGCNGM